jgi:SAM-dependent methyltransferase
MKILVAIASYGMANDQYLLRLIQEYRSMDHDVDIVVLSNLHKTLDPDIEVMVGLPTKNPRSLPFAHKKLFVERMDHYDLFIYSEDDTLITEQNIEAFLSVTPLLPKHQIAGFLRTETNTEGKLYFSTVHSYYHWEPSSIHAIGPYTFAYFTNEHSACFLLTREQLRNAIASGGFLVPPHQGKYGLLETAATDPYTQCGFQKLICISHLQDFTVRHLPNKYLNKLGLESTEFNRQIDALLRLQRSQYPPPKLLNVETKLINQKWSKSYYEDSRLDMLAVLPDDVQRVLSIGCGWGATEAALIKKGIRVVGLPLDPVIAACAEAKGVEIVGGDLKTARCKLDNRRFDAIILPNILHVVRDPIDVLSTYTDLLTAQGRVVIGVPNFSYLPTRWKRIRHAAQYKSLGNYDRAGLHMTTRRTIRQWFSTCQLVVDKIVKAVPPRWRLIDRLSLGMASVSLASELIVTGKKV